MTANPALQDRVALVIGGAGDVVDGLRSAGAEAVVVEAADLHESAQADDMVAAVASQHGRLDVLVIGEGGPVDGDGTAAVARNLLVPLWLATAANGVMQAQEDGGSIVVLGSLDGHRPTPDAPAYGAAKAGLVHLTSSLAVAWGPKVRVNCVSADGGADVAGAVAFLASSAAAYVTGADLVLDGGGAPPAFLAALAGD